MKIKIDFRATQLAHSVILYFFFVETKETLTYFNRHYRAKKKELLKLIPDKKSREKLEKLNF